jgi:signal peptidase II
LRTHGKKILILSATALILYIADQWSKYVIRTTPDLQRQTLIEGWLAFNYTKNPGMALGITWAETWVISLIAIVATFAIIFYISRTLRNANTAYLVCMGLIIGGAIGNITDRLFMARIMGYGTWLDGHVVDFIHFTLEIGGYRVFPYIFNVADMGISVAIVTLLVFGKWILPPETGGTAEDAESAEGTQSLGVGDGGEVRVEGSERVEGAGVVEGTERPEGAGVSDRAGVVDRTTEVERTGVAKRTTELEGPVIEGKGEIEGFKQEGEEEQDGTKKQDGEDGRDSSSGDEGDTRKG